LLRIGRQHGVRTAEGVELGLALSHQEISSRVGASPRAIARAMSLLRERGLISTGRKHIVILRPEVLRKFAGDAPNGT
jgi:CRP/FNR family transcriptional regulator, cyclic AMP receptor protein